MKPAARRFAVLLLACGVLTLLRQDACAATTRALLVHGANDFVWSADVTPNASPDAPIGVLTSIRFRTAGDQLRWRAAGELAELPISLANRGSELLVVLVDGEWKIISGGDLRSGIPLPNNARVMALAGDGDNIWAIGGLDLTRKPTTTASQPAATSAAPLTPREARRAAANPPQSTAPTSSLSRPPRPLALFRLERGVWSLAGDAPTEYKPEQLAAISLAVLDGKLTLALVGPDRAVRVFTRIGDGWSNPRDVATLGDGAQMKLMDVRGRPALWIADANSAGALHFASDDWQKPVKLEPSPRLNEFDRRALTFSLGQLRLLATDGKGRIAEQLYNSDGKLSGEASDAIMPPTELQNRVSRVIQFIVMAALVAWMVGSLRQRPNLGEILARIESLYVAPLGRRMLGGFIDAAPLLGGLIGAAAFAGSTPPPPPGQIDLASPEVASLCAGVAIYFLHVTLMELAMGRSIGKLIAGTRVASIDGSPPQPSQILARNALRLIDVIILGVPLLAILQSPLRQRVGDMMAGTIVVMNDRAASPPSKQPPSPPTSPT